MRKLCLLFCLWTVFVQPIRADDAQDRNILGDLQRSSSIEQAESVFKQYFGESSSEGTASSAGGLIDSQNSNHMSRESWLKAAQFIFRLTPQQLDSLSDEVLRYVIRTEINRGFYGRFNLYDSPPEITILNKLADTSVKRWEPILIEENIHKLVNEKPAGKIARLLQKPLSKSPFAGIAGGATFAALETLFPNFNASAKVGIGVVFAALGSAIGSATVDILGGRPKKEIRQELAKLLAYASQKGIELPPWVFQKRGPLPLTIHRQIAPFPFKIQPSSGDQIFFVRTADKQPVLKLPLSLLNSLGNQPVSLGEFIDDLKQKLAAGVWVWQEKSEMYVYTPREKLLEDNFTLDRNDNSIKIWEMPFGTTSAKLILKIPQAKGKTISGRQILEGIEGVCEGYFFAYPS